MSPEWTGSRVRRRCRPADTALASDSGWLRPLATMPENTARELRVCPALGGRGRGDFRPARSVAAVTHPAPPQPMAVPNRWPMPQVRASPSAPPMRTRRTARRGLLPPQRERRRRPTVLGRVRAGPPCRRPSRGDRHSVASPGRACVRATRTMLSRSAPVTGRIRPDVEVSCHRRPRSMDPPSSMSVIGWSRPSRLAH